MTTTEFCSYANELQSAIMKIYGLLNNDNVEIIEPILVNLTKAFIISVEDVLMNKPMLLDKSASTPTIYFFNEAMERDVFKQLNDSRDLKNSYLTEFQGVAGNKWKRPEYYGFEPGTKVLTFRCEQDEQ